MYFIMNSGQRIDLINFRPEHVNLEDIAHHLSKICRYGGSLAFTKHYSVAQHSVLLAEYALENYHPRDLARYLLLHDAAESYLGDMINGVKQLLPQYRTLENTVEAVIFKKYNISTWPSLVKEAKELDTRILLDEAKILYPNSHYKEFTDQLKGVKPLGVDIKPEPMMDSYINFLCLAAKIGITDEILKDFLEGEVYEHE